MSLNVGQSKKAERAYLNWGEPSLGFPEKAMAPHSSTLGWKIPWTGEPGGLQPMGSRRVGHDWATSLHFSLSCIGEGNGNPLQCSCLGESQGQWSLWAASMGSHRVGHDWSDLAAAAAAWASQVAPVVKNLPSNAGDCKRLGFSPWVGKITWRRASQTTPLFFCLENPMDRRDWRATVHWVV